MLREICDLTVKYKNFSIKNTIDHAISVPHLRQTCGEGVSFFSCLGFFVGTFTSSLLNRLNPAQGVVKTKLVPGTVAEKNFWTSDF